MERKILYAVSLLLCALMCFVAPAGALPAWIPYVSDGGTQGTNWDIYAYNSSAGMSFRLTSDSGIDNHPEMSPNGAWLVFSSTRGFSGEFDLYLADFTNVEGTIRQLTHDTYTNGPQTSYPDRHPHFHPNGRTVIFTSKNRPLTNEVQVISECCVPKIIVPPRFYENINIIDLTPTGTVSEYIELDLQSAWSPTGYPNIWTNTVATYVGHPSFSHSGTQIVFTASIDGDGKVWEVYKVGFDTNSLSLVSNSLRRVTQGPVVGANPIQMSGGAHFSENDSQILFSSTRTTNGNSLIFSVSADATNVPVTNAVQKTSHAANDYVPEPMPDGSFIVTSDLNTQTMLPSDDLDLVLVATNGARSNVTTNDASDEMMLIGDEVSWFCGISPNLKADTYFPRTFPVESLWLERSAWRYLKGYDSTTLIPTNLLVGFGYPDQAIRMYALGWKNMKDFMEQVNPSLWNEMQGCMTIMDNSGFPGLNNTNALRSWMQTWEASRNFKHVVPSIMHDRGLGAQWTPWVTTWENPTGGSFSAPSNWDLGLPGTNDIVKFDTSTLLQNAVVEMGDNVQVADGYVMGVGWELTSVSGRRVFTIAQGLNIGSITGITSLVISNLDVMVNRAMLTTNANLRIRNSFFDVFTEVDIGAGGYSNRLTISSGGTVRAPSLNIGPNPAATPNVVEVNGGNLYITNANGTGWIGIEAGALVLTGGVVIAQTIMVTDSNAQLELDAGSIETFQLLWFNGRPLSIGNDYNADGSVDLSDTVSLQSSQLIANAPVTVREDGILTGNSAFDVTMAGSPLVVQGRIAPGKSAGVITIDGNLMMTNAAVLEIELGGTTPGSGYDQLNVNGNVSLDGKLYVKFINSFVPTNGDSFTVLMYTSLSNLAWNTSLPALSSDQRWTETYNGTSLVLTVAAVTDSDSDGMDDSWETNHFGSITNSNGSGDFDGDRMNDFSEYVASTHPTNPASALKFSAIALQQTNLNLSFQSVNGIQYRLEATDTLISNPVVWTEATNVLGTDETISVTNLPIGASSLRFYRLRMQR